MLGSELSKSAFIAFASTEDRDLLMLKAKRREKLLRLTNDLSHLSPGLLLLKTDEFSWSPSIMPYTISFISSSQNG